MAEPLMAAIVLAAGSSKRFGSENKLLADAGGRSVIESVFANVVECGFDVVVVVTAPDQPAIENLVHMAGFTAVVNPHPELGMGTSIACGMKELSRQTAKSLAGVAIFLGDMPAVDSDMVCELIGTFKRSGSQNIVRPVNILDEGKTPGHPVIFPSDLFTALECLTGDAGAKQLISQHRQRLIEVVVTDRGATIDIDNVQALNEIDKKISDKKIGGSF